MPSNVDTYIEYVSGFFNSTGILNINAHTIYVMWDEEDQFKKYTNVLKKMCALSGEGVTMMIANMILGGAKDGDIATMDRLITIYTWIHYRALRDNIKLCKRIANI